MVHRQGPDGALRRVIVDLDAAIVAIPGQNLPAAMPAAEGNAVT